MPELDLEVTVGDWDPYPKGPCNSAGVERPVALTFDAPDGIAVLIEDAYLGRPLGVAWRRDGRLEVQQRGGEPWPACFRVRAVGWDAEVVDEIVGDLGGAIPADCSHAPGPAAWWLLLWVTGSARRARRARSGPA